MLCALLVNNFMGAAMANNSPTTHVNVTISLSLDLNQYTAITLRTCYKNFNDWCTDNHVHVYASICVM